MKQRIVTSLLLIPLLSLSLISELFLFLFMFLICLQIILETNIYIYEKNKKIRILIYFILISVYYFLIITNSESFVAYTLPLILISLFTSLFLNILSIQNFKTQNINVPQYPLIKENALHKIILRETSAIFFIFGISTVFFLYQSFSDIKWLLIPLLTVFSVDTFSYLLGSKFGKRKIKFLVKISPNKTVVGYIFGIIFGILMFIILNLLLGKLFTNFILLLSASIFFPVAAIIGDLHASSIKRNFGIKNYGNIFPGHGGLLDRLDSVTLSIVCMTVVKVLIV